MFPADGDHPRIQPALDERRGLIRERCPDALCTVSHGDDPAGFCPNPIVDIEGPEEVPSVNLSRMVGMQIDEGPPVCIAPGWPDHRREANWRAQRARHGDGRAML